MKVMRNYCTGNVSAGYFGQLAAKPNRTAQKSDRRRMLLVQINFLTLAHTQFLQSAIKAPEYNRDYYQRQQHG